MIAYNKTRIRDIIEEVRTLVNLFINNFNFDFEYALTQVVQAIRFATYFLLPYKTWGFVDKMTVQHKSVLPLKFIKPVKLTITNNLSEARFVNFREYYQLTNWRYAHSWNRPTLYSPIFTITGENLNKVIYIAPNNDFQTGTAPTGFTYYDGPSLTGILEFYAVPDYNDLDENSNFPYPEEFKNLVVLDTAIRMLTKVADNYMLLNLHKQLNEIKSQLWNKQVAILMATRRDMDEFVEQVPPLAAPAVGEQGELPKKLI